jgi:DNA polymerase
VPVLSIDFETRSACDIKRAGAWRYAADPTTDVLCLAFALDDEEPLLWTPEWDTLPEGLGAARSELLHRLLFATEVRAWNVAFERAIWERVMMRKYALPAIAEHRWRDTAAEAAAMSLPRSLDECARVLGVSQQKDDVGYRVMLQLSQPRRLKDSREPIFWTRATAPEKFDQLDTYCLQDVRVEREIAKQVRRLDPRELAVWQLDQRINARGVRLDVPLILAARAMARREQDRANAALSSMTSGMVEKITSRADLLEWMRLFGVNTKSVDKATTAELLRDGSMHPAVRGVLELRSENAKTSVAKLDAMLACVDADHRARGLLFYHAAGTGRWGGRLIQPQNFPRPEIKKPEQFIPQVLKGDDELIGLFHPPMVVLSSLLRSCLTAAPGKALYAADAAQIEARLVNWVAGQDDVVELFRNGAKIYERMGAMIFGVPVDAVGKDSDERQLGKAAELGCGFQMGWKKFKDTAAKPPYNVTLDDELAQRAVQTYRDTHPKVKQFWYDANDAAKVAVEHPGQRVAFGPRGDCVFVSTRKFLWLQLPSKRLLCYPAPKIEERIVPWWDAADHPPGTPPEKRPAVTVSGVDSQTRRWVRYALYGGLITENIVQALARDIIAEAMLRADAAGYEVVLSVHDEIVSEAAPELGLAGFEAAIAGTPEWAPGFPVKWEAWAGPRYRK